MTRSVSPAARVRGTLRVPGDKSASHRALILGALASGTSAIYGLSSGADVAASARIVAQLGARVTAAADHVSVHGPAHGLHASDTPLDCENSGTTMRLIAGVVAGIPGAHTLVGDASLSRRPMDRIAQPLRLMGASVTGHGDDVRAPIAVVGTDAPRAIDYAVPVPSAQVKSAVLLCGLGAAGHTIVHEAVRTRTTTEEMLVHAGVTLHSVDDGAGRD
ncbi:MAG: 3-phosphoshikimate 1-carboxyvinyltransferase, partial [Acidimicrobiales bacterium]